MEKVFIYVLKNLFLFFQSFECNLSADKLHSLFEITLIKIWEVVESGGRKLLRRWNLFLIVVVLIFMISWFIIPGFEVPNFLIVLVGSILFLSLVIEHLRNEMKTVVYLYIFVAFIGFLAGISELF